MTTAVDLINLALKQANVLGVGQTASAEDLNDAFALLNMMLAQWQRRRYLIPHLVHYSWQADGSQSYALGPGGVIDVRPSRIESCFFRQILTQAPFQVDYPLEIIEAREDYDRIGIKELASFPQYAFYDSAYPAGNLYVWPIPDGIYEIHISVMDQLVKFDDPYTDIDLPPEYQEAIMYALTMRLYPMYGLPVNPVVQGLARVSINIIEAANAQIPLSKMPNDLLRRGHYNPYSDSMR